MDSTLVKDATTMGLSQYEHVAIIFMVINSLVTVLGFAITGLVLASRFGALTQQVTSMGEQMKGLGSFQTMIMAFVTESTADRGKMRTMIEDLDRRIERVEKRCDMTHGRGDTGR